MSRFDLSVQKGLLGLNYLSRCYKINYNPQWFDSALNNQWNAMAQKAVIFATKVDGVLENLYAKKINSYLLHKISNHNLIFLGFENLETGELRCLIFSCVKMHIQNRTYYAKELPECLKLITLQTVNVNSEYKSAVHKDLIAISFKNDELITHFKQDVVTSLQPMIKSMWNHNFDSEENYLIEFSNFAQKAYFVLNNLLFKLAPLSICMQDEKWIVKFKDVDAFSNLDSVMEAKIVNI